MANVWDTKHDPESLVDYGQQPEPPLSNVHARTSHYETDHPPTTASTYNDPYALAHDRNSYYSSTDRTSQHLPSDSSPAIRDSLHEHRASKGEDFSSKGSLVKNAGEISGSDFYSNDNRPPVEQMGMLHSRTNPLAPASNQHLSQAMQILSRGRVRSSASWRMLEVNIL
jgi:hypothetical protein